MLNVRNLCVFTLALEDDALERLPAALAEYPVADPGPLEMERSGFAPPSPSLGNDQLVRRLGDYSLFSLVIRKRVLPDSVVREHVTKAMKEIQEREGRPVGSRERKRLKQTVTEKLMPQAFIKPQVIRGWIDARGWLVVDTSSVKNAETVMSRLRDALGSLAGVPLLPADPRRVFHDWLRDGAAGDGFALNNACVLADASAGSTWTGRCVDLVGVEVEEHLKAGAAVKRLGLIYNARVRLVFGDDGIIRKFELEDVVLEEASESLSAEDALEEFDAVATLLCGEARQLIEAISSTFECQAVAA